jgi:hypothetical protein
LPLYEANLTLDTKKTIRENVETILSTMGDARLIWSQGRYRLSLQYPATNAQLIVAETITDDSLLLDQNFEISFPNASQRLNYCTVKFHNEAENFKEDTASWPPKLGPDPIEESYLVGIGAKYYSLGTAASGWDITKPTGAILNDYSVWDGNSPITNLTYLFRIPKELVTPPSSNSFNLEYAGDDKMTFSLVEYPSLSPVTTGSTNKWNELGKQSNVTLGNASQDKVYRLTITAEDTSGEQPKDKGSRTKSRGVAFRILRGTNEIIWNTREPTYDDFVLRTVNNYLYRGNAPSGHPMFGFKGFLEEDNFKELEEEIFAEGITDYYHALAKAEEIVRTSRGSFGVKFLYHVNDRILEPGDFVQLSSETFSIGQTEPLYIRVNEINLREDFICEVEGTRFDASFLAWNVKDDEYVMLAPLYDERVPAPGYVEYYPPAEAPYTNSGKLIWEAVSYIDFKHYSVYMHIEAYGADENYFPIFRQIGSTQETFYELPAIDAMYAIFAVTTVSKSGKESQMAYANMDFVDGKYRVTGVAINQPWLDENGNFIWDNVEPVTQDGGQWADFPTPEQLGDLWRQNTVISVNGLLYILTDLGNGLEWVLYDPGGLVYFLVIESSNGTLFRLNEARTTTLKPRLFKNGAEITEFLTPNICKWRRVSRVPRAAPDDDATWDATHITGYLWVEVDIDDIESQATFFCDIIPLQYIAPSNIAFILMGNNLNDEEVLIRVTKDFVIEEPRVVPVPTNFNQFTSKAESNLIENIKDTKKWVVASGSGLLLSVDDGNTWSIVNDVSDPDLQGPFSRLAKTNYDNTIICILGEQYFCKFSPTDYSIAREAAENPNNIIGVGGTAIENGVLFPGNSFLNLYKGQDHTDLRVGEQTLGISQWDSFISATSIGDKIWLFDGLCAIWRSVDNGVNWTQLHPQWSSVEPWEPTIVDTPYASAVNPTTNRIVIGGTGLIADPKYIAYSIDDGVTWTRVTLPLLPAPYDTWHLIAQISFNAELNKWGCVGYISENWTNYSGVLLVYNEDFTESTIYPIPVTDYIFEICAADRLPAPLPVTTFSFVLTLQTGTTNNYTNHPILINVIEGTYQIRNGYTPPNQGTFGELIYDSSVSPSGRFATIDYSGNNAIFRYSLDLMETWSTQLIRSSEGYFSNIGHIGPNKYIGSQFTWNKTFTESSDGGATWTDYTGSLLAGEIILALGNPNTGYYIGGQYPAAGEPSIVRSLNGVAGFSEISLESSFSVGESGYPTQIANSGDKWYIALSTGGIAKSVDNGATWSAAVERYDQYNSPPALQVLDYLFYKIIAVACNGTRVVFLADEYYTADFTLYNNFRLFYSNDDASTWNTLDITMPTGYEHVDNIPFEYANKLYYDTVAQKWLLVGEFKPTGSNDLHYIVFVIADDFSGYTSIIINDFSDPTAYVVGFQSIPIIIST